MNLLMRIREKKRERKKEKKMVGDLLGKGVMVLFCTRRVIRRTLVTVATIRIGHDGTRLHRVYIAYDVAARPTTGAPRAIASGVLSRG